MALETKLRQLVARLPAKQQMLDFSDDNHWMELSLRDQQSCRQAIVDLLLRVALAQRDENDSESANGFGEDKND